MGTDSSLRYIAKERGATKKILTEQLGTHCLQWDGQTWTQIAQLTGCGIFISGDN